MNKYNIGVYIINFLTLCLFLFALYTYLHRKDIMERSMPITDFVILEKNCSNKRASIITLSYLNKTYYVSITSEQCKKYIPNKMSYYYDTTNDVVFEKQGVKIRKVIFFFILLVLASIWSFRVSKNNS